LGLKSNQINTYEDQIEIQTMTRVTILDCHVTQCDMWHKYFFK